MADSTVSALAVFDNGSNLNYVEKDGEFLFSAEEIGRHLGYGDPSNSVHKLFRKNFNELKLYAVEAKLASTDGKSYATRLFTEEGVYILSMLSRTNEAKKFRARVALLLRRLRQEAIRREVDKARAEALEEGRRLALPEALRLQKRLTSERMELMKKALAYEARGFYHVEIAKMLDCSHDKARKLLRDARAVGMCGKDNAPQIRCGNCNKLLGKGTALDLSIKCPRCGCMNHIMSGWPPSIESRELQEGCLCALRNKRKRPHPCRITRPA